MLQRLDINLKFERSVIEIDLYGTPVKLRKPYFSETQDYKAKLQALPENDEVAPIIKAFIVKMGLPENLFEQLEMEHVSEIMGLLTGSKKK
jgi:hypothetical protein